ncbi:hypothetical protein [Peribacillus alkalitolerans]|uniref:hypothetical protein n=1 Tax=Peribacillus alkalitolerans TaxID=1550385 RepID=UPI0013D670DB|nr:hypothetical protein [Peribacillus alkalitolerans]
MRQKKVVLPLFIGLTVALTGCNTGSNVAEAKNLEKVEVNGENQQQAQITKIDSINAMTLQVTFNKALTPEEVDPNNLENIKKNFVFDNNLSIVNVPRLKSGSKDTYIVPVTIQKHSQKYTLEYKGQKQKVFESNTEKINIRQVQQVTSDTFELESFLEDGVTDYANIIEAYRSGRGSLAFEVDHKNRANGIQYQIISSLRDRNVTLTSDNGEKIIANYVPFTQAADQRQAPKFRLPVGKVLEPGKTYTVTSNWADIKSSTFTAKEMTPLNIESVTVIDNKSIQVNLSQDPGSELFAGRQLKLIGEDGSELLAQYRFSSRKGATGIFDLLNNQTLNNGVKYTVIPLNNWAGPNTVTFVAK